MKQERDFDEVFDLFMDQENLHRTEGRRGVETLCQLARAIGYKDPMYFGQLTSKATLGDLIYMLEDNPGMIQAMLEWVQTTGGEEWKEELESQLCEDEDDEVGDGMSDAEADEDLVLEKDSY